MSLRVLIVDDESATREVIKKLADWDKYSMEVAAEADNGEDALAYIENHKVDIIITDMNMPGMDGAQLLEVLTKKYSQIQTIVVSGYDDFKYLQHAIRARSVDYLLKPINPLELNKALEKTALAWKKRRIHEPVCLTEENKAFIPLLKEYRSKLFSIIQARDLNQLKKLFEDAEKKIRQSEGNKPDFSYKLHQEMTKILEEQLYMDDVSLDVLNISEKQLMYNADKTEEENIASFYINFVELIRYLSENNQENSFLQVQDVKAYIDRNFMERTISLRQIAGEFHISKEYLSKAFKEKFRVNITEYILSLRMEKARQLIEKDQMTIKYAAEYVGYEDLAYFYRVWKKYFNFPPGQLKKSKDLN